MAKVNPEVQPQNAPTYSFGQPTGKYETHWQQIPTRPMPPSTGDKTLGVALEGLGNTIKLVTGAADTYVKTVIDEAIASGVDRQREGFTGALEQIGGVPQTQRVAQYQPDTSGNIESQGNPALNIIQGSEATPVPAGLNQGLNSAASLTNSASSGKLSPTYYYSRLDLLSKDLRSQYPGYRDYIDTKISSMTGGNPANEYMKSLLTSINTNLTNKHSDTEKALALVAKNPGVEGSVTEARILSSGTVSDPIAHAIGWLHDWAAVDIQNQRKLQEISLFKGEQDKKVSLAKESASSIANSVFNNTWKETIQGLGKTWEDLQKMTPEELNQFAHGNDAQGQQLGQATQLAANNVRIATQKRLTTPGPDGKSMADILGPTETKNIVDEAARPFETIAQGFLNNDYGVAHSNSKFITAKTNDANAWLLRDSSIKDQAAMYLAISKDLGPAAANYFTATSGALTSLDTATQEYIKFQKERLLTDPKATLNGIIDDMKTKGIGDSSDPRKQAQAPAFKAVTEIPKFIADPQIKDSAKTKLINASFSPDNFTLIPKFADDTFDSKGNLIPGKHTILQSMTTPEITNEVYRLSQGNPALWTTYTAWVDRTTNDLIRNDISDISRLETNPNIQITWNTEKHQFGINFKDTFFVNPYNIGKSQVIQNTLANQYRASIAKINEAIKPKVNVALKEGGDVNTNLLNYLVNGLQLDPRGVDMPSELLRTVMGPPQSKQEEPIASTKSDETSLKTPSWTAQPGAAFNETISRLGKKLLPQIPQLEDWTKSSIGAAKDGQIVGAANAAHISTDWGNPLSPEFPSKHLTPITTPSGKQVEVNTKAADAFKGFLTDLETTGYKIHSIGGYSLRTSKGNPRSLSQHAFGNAIDINPDQNPYSREGKNVNNLPANISDIAAKWGISWGGDWKSVKDPMHFEYTGRTPKRGQPGYELTKSK